jgi:hypothetical protein
MLPLNSCLIYFYDSNDTSITLYAAKSTPYKMHYLITLDKIQYILSNVNSYSLNLQDINRQSKNHVYNKHNKQNAEVKEKNVD